MTMGSRPIPHKASLFGQALLLSSLTFGLCVVPSGNDPYIAWPVIALFYVYFVRSFFSPMRIRSDIPTYTTIETLFLMFYFLLFINPYQAHFLGISDLRNNSYLSFVYEAGSNQALLAAAIGFVAFHLGISLTRTRARQNTFSGSDRVDEGTYYHAFGYVVVALLAGFILIYEIAGLQSSDEGRYTKVVSGGAIADGIYLIIIMLCIVGGSRAIALIAQRRALEFPILISLPIIAYWSVRILIHGDRNSFFLIAIAAGGGFFTFVRRTSWIALATCVLVSLFVYSAVETIRMSQDRSFSTLLEKMFEEKPSEEANRSSSFSITTATLRATFDIVPERQDYGYGKYKLIGFAGIVPLIRGSLLGSDAHLTNTAEVLSNYMLGPNAGWSVGSNLLTDIYMDFGVLGIPVLVLLAGLFAGTIQKSAIASPYSTPAITFYLLVLGNFAELSRYTLDSPVRMLTWTYLLFLGYDAIMRMRGYRPPTSRAIRRTIRRTSLKPHAAIPGSSHE
ncbi:O-antigen polysaccharide polymerase Wzy [Bradyrhizobium sp. 38]|uniref:O-antigen polysaccharide polymerase Wzy n=1 Tax=unclassified Bradyrhizobium TaxID=2631580 RepID=UPI001FFB4808|nr:MULTISPECIES: O-antigen polysaccharide polymerase Wzy [unclassified Bradyrhizobium]MCK1341637.1 O-antigen polysaccharide polymerase Wzy [Bradyrhizobium sp. 38]MCK1778832.1 O-antigen polysaccharide polymerase Wzy [Bradyrhizobium sp. 132]